MTVHHIDDFAGCLHALKQADLRQALYDEAAILMQDVVVNLHGEEHKARREVEATIFRKDVFLHYEKVILPQILHETMAPFLQAGRGDLKDIGYRILLNLTVDFTGIDRPERSAEETGDLLRLLREFSLAPALGQRLAEDTEPLKARIRTAIDEFDCAYFTRSLQRRESLLNDHLAGRLDKDALPKDVLMALVAQRESLGITRKQLLKEAIYFVLAGAHTSINALTHAVHDIFGWLELRPGDRRRVLEDPFFIQACVFESLRLNPSSPVAKRRALCPVSLREAEAAPDDEIVINLHAANRNAELFGEAPTAFNPHRTPPSGLLPYGLSMGHGAHACLGRNLAVGVAPRKGADPVGHQYGTVPLIVEALFHGGVAPDPNRPPRRDETVARFVWAEYPVIFRSTGECGG